MMTPPQIRKLLLDTPDPLQWDCFTFGIIQGEDRFTVYIAIDHLRADGMSAGVIFLDVQTTYFTTPQSAPVALAPAASHREYCINQRAHTANLNEESPQIQSWRAFLAASAGAAARPDAHLCANLGTLQQTGCDPVHPSFASAERAVSRSAVTDSWHAWAHSRPHLHKADQIVRRVN